MNKGLFLEKYFMFFMCCIRAGQGCTLVTHGTNAQHYVSLYHLHHVWCACRSQEEFTDSYVSCRVTSRLKHFLISLQIWFWNIYIYIYIYFPLPLPNLPVCTLFSYLATFFEKCRLLRVVLDIFWGRGLATLQINAYSESAPQGMWNYYWILEIKLENACFKPLIEQIILI